MDSNEFSFFRKKLGKTQKKLAELLGTSLKAVSSYEQGWRTIPAHVERQIYFLISRKYIGKKPRKKCWEIKNCPTEIKKKCPAWEFQSGTLCWFINGTICGCASKSNWQEKIEICRQCEVMSEIFKEYEEIDKHEK